MCCPVPKDVTMMPARSARFRAFSVSRCAASGFSRRRGSDRYHRLKKAELKNGAALKAALRDDSGPGN